MARKKRRFEQLQAAAAAPKETRRYNDPIQERVGQRLEEAGKKLEGKGRTILYGLAAAAVLVVIVLIFMNWSRRSTAAAQTALGKAIETSQARIADTPAPAGSTDKTFKTEKERAEAAIAEFQMVAEKYGGDVAEKARYFIAVNKLFIDRSVAVQELQQLAGSGSETGKLAKFALAQAYMADDRTDEAVRLLQDLDGMDNPIVAKETVRLELARALEKQGKKQEAADIYFDIAKIASEAKDIDGKPARMSDAATTAKEKITELDPERAKQIVEQTPESPFGGGLNIQ
jgi:DNA-binding protein Fis